MEQKQQRYLYRFYCHADLKICHQGVLQVLLHHPTSHPTAAMFRIFTTNDFFFFVGEYYLSYAHTHKQAHALTLMSEIGHSSLSCNHVISHELFSLGFPPFRCRACALYQVYSLYCTCVLTYAW